MSEKAVSLRKATGKMMDDNYDQLEKHVDDTSFPHWIVDKFRALKINGLTIKDFGSPALSTLEAGSIIFELGKRDGSIATFFLVHNSIGMAVVDVLGDEE
jgi:glutaryl-CoA dehydrogenase